MEQGKIAMKNNSNLVVKWMSRLLIACCVFGAIPMSAETVPYKEARVDKSTNQTPPSGPNQAVIKVRVIEDTSNSFQYFKRLQSDGFWQVADSEMLQGILKILSKNGLVKMVADPTVATVSGRPVQLNSGNSKNGTEIRLNWFKTADSIRIEIKAEIKKDGQTLTVDTATETNPGGSTVLKIGPPSQTFGRCYLIITPELVR